MDSRETNHKWYSSFDEKRMVFTLELETDVEIPAKFEVCSVCNGKGKHVNPSIDSHGLSREDFDEDPDFAEDYFSGVYDVQCYTCHGNRVEPVVDEERCSPEILKLANDTIQEHYEYEALCAAERRMGC